MSIWVIWIPFHVGVIYFTIWSLYQSETTDLPEQVNFLFFGVCVVSMAHMLCLAAEPLLGHVPGASFGCQQHEQRFG